VSVPKLVQEFYARIWNAGDLEAVADLLSEDFLFRGSLGAERRGHEGFKDYVRSVRGALVNYRCEILECVTEGRQAFAKMRFSGIHVAEFRGYLPSGMPVHWLGAALFHLGKNTIAELWVLGDLAALDALLKKNYESTL
jgi:predicted ester cyclase